MSIQKSLNLRMVLWRVGSIAREPAIGAERPRRTGIPAARGTRCGRVSIRDLSTILEGIADALAFSRNPATMVEHVRARLARQICAQNTSYNGYLPLIALSARWEQAFAESIVGQGEDRSLAMQPSKLSEFMTAVRNAFEQAAREGEAPVLVTSAAIRPVRALAGRAVPLADHRAVAGRNPPAGAAEDGRQRVAELATCLRCRLRGSRRDSEPVPRLIRTLGRAAFPPQANGLSEQGSGAGSSHREFKSDLRYCNI